MTTKISKPRIFKTPLAYVMAVINDPDVDSGRRDRLALAAAPYFHAKPATVRTYDYTTKKQSVENAALRAAKSNKNGVSDLEFRVPDDAPNTSDLYSP